jgi:hypothetical protein
VVAHRGGGSTRLLCGPQLRLGTGLSRCVRLWLHATSNDFSIACIHERTLPIVCGKGVRLILAAYPTLAHFYYFDLNQNSATHVSVPPIHISPNFSRQQSSTSTPPPATPLTPAASHLAVAGHRPHCTVPPCHRPSRAPSPAAPGMNCAP